jgi:hypothetical protein
MRRSMRWVAETEECGGYVGTALQNRVGSMVTLLLL